MHSSNLQYLFRFAWKFCTLAKARIYGRDTNLANAYHLLVAVIHFMRYTLGLQSLDAGEDATLSNDAASNPRSPKRRRMSTRSSSGTQANAEGSRWYTNQSLTSTCSKLGIGVKDVVAACQLLHEVVVQLKGGAILRGVPPLPEDGGEWLLYLALSCCVEGAGLCGG